MATGHVPHPECSQYCAHYGSQVPFLQTQGVPHTHGVTRIQLTFLADWLPTSRALSLAGMFSLGLRPWNCLGLPRLLLCLLNSGRTWSSSSLLHGCRLSPGTGRGQLRSHLIHILSLRGLSLPDVQRLENHCFMYLHMYFIFTYFVFFIFFLVVSGMKVNQVPLSPSWSDPEVTEPQTGPDVPGATSLFAKLKQKAAVPLGSQESWSPVAEEPHPSSTTGCLW